MLNLEQCKEICSAGWPNNQREQVRFDAEQWLIQEVERLQKLNGCSDERPCIPCFTDNGPCVNNPPQAVQPGWKLVPIEPTTAMLEQFDMDTRGVCKNIYSAMLAAAPSPEGGEAMTKEFKRENKYLVLKIDDINKYLSDEQQLKLDCLVTKIRLGRLHEGKHDQQYVCIAADWPMYEQVWAMVQTFVESGEEEI